jgi:hypothetical protein
MVMKKSKVIGVVGFGMLWCIYSLLHFEVSAQPLQLGSTEKRATITQPSAAKDMKNAVRLRARVFVPKPGVDRELKRYFDEMAQEKTAHVIVQFAAVPSLQEREVLEKEMKVRLLDPVPERAFFAAMPPGMALAKRLVTDGKPARWIGMIAPKDKVAPWLLRDGMPIHARRPEGKVEVIVQFFGDVEVKGQEQILVKHHAKVLTHVVPLNGWRVTLAEGSLLKLAAEDPVKWIEEIPAPPEDDNDGVRSATGVNADAVLPPMNYNLTGTGVVVAQWESTHASLSHGDFTGRITLADPPIPPDERTWSHDESVAVNGQFDSGEAIYRDVDDSGTVSAGDVRATAVGAFPAGSTVAAGNPDVGTGLVIFNTFERFADSVTADFLYTTGEGIYLDTAPMGTVSVGDTRLTPVGAFAAGSIVAAGDADVGQAIWSFLTNPHYHSTHVAGTVIGDGTQSAAQGGSPNQWKSVAPGATLRSYSDLPISATGAPVPTDEYTDAAANSATISTNSWGTSHCHQVFPPNTCYDVGSQYYDSVISGRRSDGTPSGLAQRILVVGSAGNPMKVSWGGPERHAEDIAVNGLYDNGEAIYRDNNDDGVVSASDSLVSGAAQPAGTALVNFNLNEMHSESAGNIGTYNSGEGIYLDADASRTVSVGDTRIAPTASYPAGSVVAAGETDIGTNLRQFKLWGNLRIPNSAKNTIEVANITSDSNALAPSSGRGPTDDGRVKPDLAGPGSQAGGDGGVTSTWPGNLYNTISGTSMSTPAVAGSAVLLTEWYKTACVTGGPTPDALKALLIHTAQDLTTIPNVAGVFTGPDFAFGYGRLRVKNAVDLLPHHLQEAAAAVGDTDYTITIGAMQPLKVTLVWNDPPWTANAAPSAVTGILQNDLDLLLIAPDGTQYTPWVVNGANPFAAAISSSFPAATPIPASARDRRNTIEQVVVPNAMAGTWTIRVTASLLNLPPQSYTLVSEALPPQVGPCASTPAADIWMRDNPSDTGTVPSSGSMWLGPDLWNRYAPDGMTTHQNPEYGQVNYLYANIRNASAVDVKATSIDIWAGSAALGLVWPNNFIYVGRFSVPNLVSGEVRQVGPLEWNPPPPAPSDHYCLYMRVASPQDPITFVETSSVWTNAMNSNNIAYRNIIVVDLLSSRSVTLLARNIERKEADVDLLIQIPREFLRTGQVYLRLSPELEKRWPQKYRKVEGLISLEKFYGVVGKREQKPSEGEAKDPEDQLTTLYQITAPVVALRGFRMEPHQAERVTVIFRSDQREKASFDVHVVEQIHGKTIGGILYIVRTGYGKEK